MIGRPALGLVTGLLSLQLHAADGELQLALGGFDVTDSGTFMGQVEYRPAVDWSGFRPQLGGFFTADSAAYLYAGIGYPFAIGDRWSLIPSISMGYYREGDDKDMGDDLEFYSQLRVAYRLDNNAQLGLGIGHLSNAGLGDENPGAESLYLSYGLGL